jgi:CubicO group peptidase (beta-lactamase class C family)
MGFIKKWIVVVGALAITGCKSASLPQTNPGGPVTIHSWSSELPIGPRPNDATISFYENRKLEHIRKRKAEGNTYSILPKGNATPFKQVANPASSILKKQLANGYILSYLYYEDGVIKYNGKAADGRFEKNINDETWFRTHSTGKSIVSYIVGHAICEGYISSADEIIDWPMMRDTLYQGQSLQDLLNMQAGDRHVVNSDSSKLAGLDYLHRDMGMDTIAHFLAGSKKGSQEVFYNNILSDIIASYVAFKAGDKYDELMHKVFQDKVKIQHEVMYEKHQMRHHPVAASEYHGTAQTRASYSFFITRMDLLRVAEAMMKDYQSQNCVGQYLKKSQQQANSWPKYRSNFRGLELSSFAKRYGSQFYFDFEGMRNRNIMATEGKNQQNIMIDMDNSRIVVVNSAATAWYQEPFILDVIRNGKLPE